MLSTHESLGVLFQRKGELSAAAREYSWVSDHIGLAYTECYLSCSSIPNTVMMWAHSTFRLARLLEQAGDPDGANEAYSLFLDRWGDAQMAEVALARQRVGDVSP